MPSVFLSYSHKDEVWKDRLRTHLGVLEAQGLLDTWDDRRIEAGADWFEEIQEAMSRANVAVLLISADFLTSKFILGQEVPRLLNRRIKEGLPVIPVIVHSCAWDQVKWLKEIQARPKDGRALAGFEGERRHQELTKITKELLEILDQDIAARETTLNLKPRRNEDNFLDRVEAVCRLREPDAEIRRYPGIGEAGGYLRVVRRVGAILDMYPVGAIEYGLTYEGLQTFITEIDAPYRRNDQGLISYLVYGGAPAPPYLVANAESRRVHLVSFVEFQGLIDFRNYLNKQTTKLAEDPIYPPRLYVPQRMRTLSLLGSEDNEIADALAQVREWLDSPHGRFLVLLGDFGTGKTFLLHELARRMGEAEGGLVPILLQMRSLEKGRSLDELLAQHFAQEGMEGFSPAKFRYMLEQGRIALLFDGFDELALRVTYAKAADHFTTLLQAAIGSAKVVLTSRRQHFLSESQVKTALAERVESLSRHRLAILQPFDREQVSAFLVNVFAGDEAKAEARLDLVDRVKDLLGLSSNPRLLGFIAELPEDQLVAASMGGEITAARLYELLLDRWLVLEFDRVHPKGAPPGLSIDERWRAVTLLAMRMWQKIDRFVSLSDLTEEAAHVVKAVGPASPDSELAAFQVGSGTLLIRDDEDNFAFLHQSILEWLVARRAAVALASGADPDALAVREISPLMADFFSSLAGKEQAVSWARSVLASQASETAKKNALLVLERQKEAVRESLALTGQDLSGKDLSGRDLSGADLSGADLAATRLLGTRLTKVRLTRASLREANLSFAFLTGADLTEADLTGARLIGADLRGARLNRASLRRAKLLGAALDVGSIETADFFGASLNPSELHIQTSVSGECQSVAWSPDGELLASTAGNVIWLWEAESGRQIRTLRGHDKEISSLAFSPSGRILASGSWDQTIRLWQVENGQELHLLKGHKEAVRCVAFSPDGKALASGSDDHTIRLWEVDDARLIRAFLGHSEQVLSLAFSPDGEILASASSDRMVRLWEIPDGGAIRALRHERAVSAVAFSPDGMILASGTVDKIYLWRVTAGRRVGTLFCTTRTLSMAFSLDGKTLASGGDDHAVRLWQVESGSVIHTLRGHQERVTSVAFKPHSKSLASGSSDQTIRLWELDEGRKVRILEDHTSAILSLTFSTDGQTLACGSNDQTIRLWQTGSGKEVRSLNGHAGMVLSVAFSPDGQTLASGSNDQTVRLWQTNGGREIRALSGHQGRVSSVAFSPDGKTVASGSADQTVRFWRIDSWREIQTFRGHSGPIESIAFSPDGKILASGSQDNTVRLWPLGSGRQPRILGKYKSPIWSIAFSPDSETLASGYGDRIIRLWQIDNGQNVQTFKGHQGTVFSVTFSPDGKSLASGSADNNVRLWEVDSGREIRCFTGHRNHVRSVSFSPDGRSLASGSDDGTIRLWSVPDDRCLVVLLPLPEGWVAYSPDGRYKFGGIPAGGFWHAANLCRFEIGELDEWVPGLRLEDDASFFDLPPWKPEIRVPERIAKAREGHRLDTKT